MVLATYCPNYSVTRELPNRWYFTSTTYFRYVLLGALTPDQYLCARLAR